MAKRRHSAASRDSGAARVFRWLMLTLVGAGGGILLGDLAVGRRMNGLPDGVPSYSRLSANPDALVPQGEGAAPCPDCADSYGMAMQRRAHRDARMSDEFRELGAVDVDPPLPVDPVDDYRFGGRFPDPEPNDRKAETQVVDTLPAAPAGENLPDDETPLPSAED